MLEATKLLSVRAESTGFKSMLVAKERSHEILLER